MTNWMSSYKAETMAANTVSSSVNGACFRKFNTAIPDFFRDQDALAQQQQTSPLLAGEAP